MELISDTRFQNLTKTEQVSMVMCMGKKILERVSDQYLVDLYILSNIFVEVWHETETNNIIKLNTTNKQSINEDYEVTNNVFYYIFNEQET